MFSRVIRPVKCPQLRFARLKHTVSQKKRAREIRGNWHFAVGMLLGGGLGYYYGDFEAPSPAYKFPLTSTTKLKDLDTPEYADLIDVHDGFAKIKKYLGSNEKYSQDNGDLEHYSTNDYSTHSPSSSQKPKLVVFPESTEEVSEILKIAHEYAIPVVPQSGGTSIEGNFISTKPGIVISLARMDKILQLNKEDFDVTVQPGVGWQDLNEYLAPYDLLFGPDPGPGAQIAGMCGTSCSGTNAARYGTMKDNVINLTVVLPDGTIVKTKNRPRKSSAGYNLTNFFIGSEGTLGIITEVTVKLHLKPKFERVSVVSFPRIIDATNMVISLVQNGIQVNAVELLDENMIDVINKSGQCKRHWQLTPTLFIKIGGPDEQILGHLIKKVETIGALNNSISFQYAANDDESIELWQARKVGFWSTIQYGKETISPDVKVWTTDVAVPISKLSKVIEETMQDIKKTDVFSTILGHVGDGNFHAILIYKPDQYEIVKELSAKMVRRAIENDGTCTGEHGIGVGKRKYLEEELGEDSIDLMRKLKLAVDPKRIMNPDKIFKIDPADNSKF